MDDPRELDRDERLSDRPPLELCCGGLGGAALRAGAAGAGALRCGAVRTGALREGALRAGVLREGALRCGCDLLGDCWTVGLVA